MPNPCSRTLALDHLDLSIFRMLALSELRQFCSCCFGLFPIESKCINVSQCMLPLKPLNFIEFQEYL